MTSRPMPSPGRTAIDSVRCGFIVSRMADSLQHGLVVKGVESRQRTHDWGHRDVHSELLQSVMLKDREKLAAAAFAMRTMAFEGAARIARANLLDDVHVLS